METDLERAVNALVGKQDRMNKLWNYYQGKMPMVYANERIREIMRRIDAQFVENWCAVIIQTTHDRINLLGFETPDAAMQKTLSDLWETCDLGIVADDVHEGALVLGEAFLIIWPNEAKEVRAYYNDARMCQAFYDQEDPYQMTNAAKWYIGDDDGLKHLTMYYADRIEHYIGPKAESASTKFVFVDDEPNPYGEIPVFRFSQKRNSLGDFELILPLQDAVNKLISDMMRAAEVAAYKQRWVISNSDTSALINAPNELWNIPAGESGMQPTQVGEFGETNMANYLDAIERIAQVVGSVSRTPYHSFEHRGNISGEALIALEAPLNKKCADYEMRYKGVWRQAAAFMLKLAGHGDVPSQRIMPKWDAIASEQPLTTAQARQLGVAAGMPLVTVLRKFEQWSPVALAQLEADQKVADTAKQTTLANAMVEAQRQFSGGQGSQ